MKYCGSLYVIEDIEKTKEFYKEVLGLRVISDFGANFTMTGGISFQTKESWIEFIEKSNDDIIYNAHNGELYFETDDLDSFIEKLKQRHDIEYVHNVKTHEWGQRGIRIYDPDYHVIEVSEKLSTLCLRLYNQGMSLEDISKKTMLSKKVIERMLLKEKNHD